MSNGVVVSIHVTSKTGQPMVAVLEARAVPGKGLEGDRYFGRVSGPDREITLIEIEAIEALRRDYRVEMAPGDARRAIVTRGIALNHLVGCEFRVGDALLRGVRLCEPCTHLAALTYQEVLTGLVHRGGLRAQILRGGAIRPGDRIVAG